VATIVVFGGTGYTGGNIVREAASRGHQVIAVSRSQPKERIEGVRYEIGAADDLASRVVPGADVVVAALSPRGDMAGRLVEVYGRLARLSGEAGAEVPPNRGLQLAAPGPGPASLRGGRDPAGVPG
jgi:uncharacterized protein YbjT (DUF2867 family)